MSALSFDSRPVRRDAKTRPRRTAPRIRYRKVPVAIGDGIDMVVRWWLVLCTLGGKMRRGVGLLAKSGARS